MKLCIVTNACYRECESFIRAHMDLLPAKIFHVYGAEFPLYTPSGGLLAKRSFFRKIKDSFLARSELKSWKSIQKDAFVSYLVRNKVDCVLAEFGTVGATVANECAKAGVPLVVHFHGYDAHAGLPRETFDYHNLFSKASRIVAVSSVMAEELMSIGAPKDKIVINVYGPHDSYFDVEHTPSDPPVLLSIGRFTEKKAPFLTIIAFADALKQVPNLKLEMIGDGPLLDSCRILIRALNIEHNVVFRGRCDSATIRAALSKCTAFVQHSVVAPSGDSEGTPVAVLEAGAAGVPVIVTRHAGIVDVVKHMETGILVNEFDVAGMSEAICKLCLDRDLVNKMGQNAKNRISDFYSMQRSIKGLYQIIKSAVCEI